MDNEPERDWSSASQLYGPCLCVLLLYNLEQMVIVESGQYR